MKHELINNQNVTVIYSDCKSRIHSLSFYNKIV